MMAFHDIHPKSKVHLLIISKKHIARVSDLAAEDSVLVGRLVYQAKLLAQDFGIAKSGYKLIINTGPDGGQIIDHLHLHLLGGEKIEVLV